MAATARFQQIPREQIAEEASHARPGHVILTVITALFYGIGWTTGATWRGIVFCCLAIRYGYREGAHIPVKAPEQEGTQ